ncbi:MAG: response regulator [Lachnospiraceae bacterium]|nr:response regulator [Lachnospiraceae bacterium]
MKRRGKLSLVLPLVTTFILITLVVIYTSRLFYRISVSNIYEVGEDKISGIAAELENYLDTAKSVLWVTADTVDHMIQKGVSNEDILDYILSETQNQKVQFDENYTGLYGCVRGEYLDGLGWEPPEGYVATERDWYKIAKAAGGDLVIVPPYIDAQTGSMVISITKLLSGGSDVISFDVITNHIQSIIEKDSNIKGKGYGFIVDKNGLIIAHSDKTKNGTDYNENAGGSELINDLDDIEDGYFETKTDGKDCVVFTSDIMDQWSVVLIVDKQDLFADVYKQQVMNISLFVVVFILLVLFYYIAYRNEQKTSRETEELRLREHQNEYAAELLRLEKSAADSANAAKGRFLAQMSHEIRTPMNAVLGMNEMILRESNEQNVLEYSENIQIAGKTLLSIINSILDFSKIEDGKMEIMPENYRTMQLVGNVSNSVAERAKAKGLEMTVDVDKNIPCMLYGDDVRLGQVIMNLLTNAVKYTENGSVTLEMKLKEMKEEEVIISVRVSDTGIGIRKEDMQKLFESFTRLDEMHNRNIEGTGLGMTIVTRLLALMDSELKVESEYGKGSVFSFDIKQQIADRTTIALEPEKHPEAVDLKKNKKKQFRSSTVLVTDDNEMNRKVSKNLLKLFGIVPDMAASGRETIEKMRAKKYDMVLLDHMMPEMDGIETFRHLKAEGLTEGKVMVALTANAVVGARNEYIKEGFDEYLSKPIGLDSLEEILARYLKEDGQSKTDGPAQGEDDEVMEFYPEETEEGMDDGFTEKLSRSGFDTKSALSYFAGDAGFYRDMLKDYVNVSDERIKELSDALEAGNIHDYEIHVHALKSISKSVGANDLYELALSLEQAAKKDDREYISGRHKEFIELLMDRVAIIKNALGLV